MSKTNNEIYGDMKRVFEETTGKRLDENSLYSKIMQATSSEIYSLYCYGDYILKQSFVQSATGEYLDRLAHLRGIARKQPESATGKLTFYVDEPTDTNINIPLGSICSVEGKPYLQFVTTRACEILSGHTECEIEATAISEGADYNVGVGEINTMVNAPVGVSGVRNYVAFTGGYDRENDEELRYRLLRCFIFNPNGVSNRFLENTVMNLEFVTDCFIPPVTEYGKIDAYVSTKTGSISESEEEKIREALGITTLILSSLNIHNSGLQNFGITVRLKVRANFDKSIIRAELDRIINEKQALCRIGRAFCLSDIEKRAVMIDGVLDATAEADNAISKTVYCDYDKKLNLTDVTVIYYDA